MISKPNFVQRCTIIKNPVVKELNFGLITADVFRLDYMGSAEFEYGAVYDAFCNIENFAKNKSMLLVKSQKIIDRDNNNMFMFGPFAEDNNNFVNYEEFIIKMIKNEIHPKSPVHMEKHFKPRKTKENLSQADLNYIRRNKMDTDQFIEEENKTFCDLWWDLRNGVIMSFNHDLMNQMPEIIENSIKFKEHLRSKEKSENNENTPELN